MATKEINILIGVTGSVAAIKLPLLVQSLVSESSDIRIKIVTTNRARHFYDSDKLLSSTTSVKSELPSPKFDDVTAALTSSSCTLLNKCEEVKLDSEEVSDTNSKHDAVVEILGDDDEWARWKRMGDPVLHIELCRWADVFVIAPLDANTLGKFANGLCDNLLTCVFRAWDTKNKPLIFCPAMNTLMWNHPITEEQVSRLTSWGHIYVSPISKKLACGDEGIGAMAEVRTIVDVVLNALK